MIHRETSCFGFFNIFNSNAETMLESEIVMGFSREAIKRILESEKITEHDEVMLPNLMCHTLIEVAQRHTKKIITYELNNDLCANYQDLIRKVNKGVRLVFIVDYFGVKSEVNPSIVKALQKERIVIVRDMAHSFLTLHQSKYEIDNYSDYVVSSIYKSLKLYSGSILLVKNKNKNKILSKNHIGAFPIVNGLVNNIIKEIFCFLGFNYRRVKIQCSNEEYFKKASGFNIYFFYKFLLNKININQVIFNRNLVSIDLYKIMEKSHIVRSLFNINQIENNLLQAFPVVFNNTDSRDLIQKLLREKCVDAYTWPHPHCLFDSNKLGDRMLLIPVDKRVIAPLKEALRCLGI